MHAERLSLLTVLSTLQHNTSTQPQVLGVGGFNSWLYNQPSLYFFDVATDPARPRYIKAVTPNKGAVADDLIRLPNGGFLVSLMGSKTGRCECELVVEGLRCLSLVLSVARLPLLVSSCLR